MTENADNPSQDVAEETTSENASQPAEAVSTDTAVVEETVETAPAETPPTEAKAKKEPRPVREVLFELRQLQEYTTKFPEIGPTVAALAVKLGHRDLAERILRLGVGDAQSMEYFFVAGDLARREKRSDDVLQLVLDALDAFAAADTTIEDDDASRLLHLVRLGFAVLMFDLEDVRSRPEWVASLVEKMNAVKPSFVTDPFYFNLLAQGLWFDDAEASESAWDEATNLDKTESAWNARGTWYKEAEKELSKAENAYRAGLKISGSSPLLMHNLAQVLLDRAEADETDASTNAGRVREADSLLRKALGRVHKRGLRRHINLTVDRVKKLRPAVEEVAQAESLPKEGDTVRGRVRNVTNYGAFLSIGQGGLTGLLHKSAISHEYIEDPAKHLKVGDQFEVKVVEVKEREDGKGWRIGLSRKAVLPKPEKQDRPEKQERKPRQARKNTKSGGNQKGGQKGGKGGDRNRSQREHRSENRGLPDDKIATLGELLLAKMQESNKDNKG